ncbi:hypothetical protein BD413DRAFT_617889 [Trametes elegans]|nr:hypothetical protein BD413DRAFT_617889 [Trametes elegans]
MGRALKRGKNLTFAHASAELRSRIRRVMKLALVRITQDKTAHMCWTRLAFHEYVFVRRRVRLLGWPSTVPFQNLGALPLATLKRLHRRWCHKQLRFVRVGEDELAAHRRDPDATAPGKCVPGPPLRVRDDIKTSRFDPEKGEPVSDRRKLRTRGAISAKYVEDSDDE